MEVADIIIYTDGAASGNPGPGGYGIILKSGKHYKEISQGFRLTTNNRMELLAVIIALESLKIAGSNVNVYTDSLYVHDAVEKGWLWKWEKSRFKNKKNQDLWLRFINIYHKHHVKFHWVKGHSSIPENERCDQLAVQALRQKNLLVDSGYEKEEEQDTIL